MQEDPTAPGTQVVPPPPTTVTEAPPAPGTPVAPVEEAQPTVAAGEEQPAPEAGEVPSPEPAEKPWGSIADPLDVLELPEFKEALQFRDQRVRTDLQAKLTQDYEKATKGWETTQAHQTINALVGNLAARINEGDFDGADRMISRLEKFREPYTEPYLRQVQEVGATSVANTFFQTMMSSLTVRQQQELSTLANSGADWGKVINKYGELREKVMGEKEYQRGLKENRAALAAQQQVQQAPGTGPNLAPGTPAGGVGYTAEQWAALGTAGRNKARAEGKQPPGAAPTR